jgi:hypothetical protein
VAGTCVCVDMGDRQFLQKVAPKISHTDNNNFSLLILPIMFVTMNHTQFSVFFNNTFPLTAPIQGR